jgi:glucosylceramidase
VQATSFVNPDGSRVVVMENKIRNDLHLQVTFNSGDVWNGNVPSRSLTTWIIPAR